MKLLDLEFLTELSDEKLALQSVAGGCDPYSYPSYEPYGSNPSDPSSGPVYSPDPWINDLFTGYIETYPSYNAAMLTATGTVSTSIF